MNITITNPSKAECFAVLFQHIKLFTEQINIMFEPNRMFIQALDSGKVSIFEIHLPAKWFDSYILTNDQPITIGLNSSTLFKILNARDKSQTINMLFSDSDSETLLLHFSSENKTIFDKHFEVPLIDIECDTMVIPAFEHQAEFSITSSNFANLINQLKMFGDTMDIQCSEDKIVLSSTSVESGKMFVDIPIDDLLSFSIDEGEDLNLSFSLSYLHHISMYNKLSKNVELCISTNYPMKLVYLLDDDADAKIAFYLAPKVNVD